MKGPMTYREPADVRTTSTIDTSALAAEVQQQEANARAVEAARLRRQELQRAKLARKADERPRRIRTKPDADGVLLSISHVSDSKVRYWVTTLCVALGTLIGVTGLVVWPGGVKLFAFPFVLAAGFALWHLWELRSRRRPLHVYAARNGFFVIYRERSDLPLAKGRLEHLEFDLRYDNGGLKKMKPLHRGARVLGDDQCDRLTPSDIKVLTHFAENCGARVS